MTSMPWYLGREQLTEMGGHSADLPVEPEQPEPEGFCIQNSMCIYSQTFSWNDKGSTALNYHWRDLLPVLFLSWRIVATNTSLSPQTRLSRDKTRLLPRYFCRDKHIFMETKKLPYFFSRQTRFCRNKHTFVATKDRFCLDKSKLVATNITVNNKQNDTCGSSR